MVCRFPDRRTILEKVGELPDTHYHCAILAEAVVQIAVDNFTANRKASITDPKILPDRLNT